MLALKWAWFTLMALALAYTAYATRFENIGEESVLDRWTQQFCEVNLVERAK